MRRFGRRKIPRERLYSGTYLAFAAVLGLSGCQSANPTPAANPPRSGEVSTAQRLYSATDALREGNRLADEASAWAPRDLARARRAWKNAQACYEDGMRLSPDNTELRFAYATALGSEAEAIVESEQDAARALWKEAGVHYAMILRQDPRHDRALNSWGLDLAAEAEAIWPTDLAAARDRWHQAGEKYAQALTILPSKHGAANNWGEAKAVARGNRTEALPIWRDAEAKFEWALRIKPDKYNALSNWGGTCADQAQAAAEVGEWETALHEWERAFAKYAESLQIHPLFRDLLFSYGTTLDEKAKWIQKRNLPEARALRRKARALFAQTLDVDPDYYGAAINWAISLESEAKDIENAKVVSEDTLPLWNEAILRHRFCVANWPHQTAPHTGLGDCLDGEARVLATRGDLPAARLLWREAETVFARSMAVRATALALLNWGGALRCEADFVRSIDAAESRRLLKMACERFALGRKLFPHDWDFPQHMGYCYNDEFQLIAAVGTTEEKQALLHARQSQHAEAVQIKPDEADAWAEWGAALLEEARLFNTTDQSQTLTLLNDAARKLVEANRLAPNDRATGRNLTLVYKDVGNLFAASARTAAREYYLLAEKQCTRMLASAPDDASMRVLLADTLCSHAVLMVHADRAEVAELTRHAGEQFRELERLAVPASEFWTWAVALDKQAQAMAVVNFAEALRIFELSGAKFAEARRARPDNALVSMSWGQMLQWRAVVLSRVDLAAARRTWSEAREKFAEVAQANVLVANARVEIGLAWLREYAGLPADDRTANVHLLEEAEK